MGEEDAEIHSIRQEKLSGDFSSERSKHPLKTFKEKAIVLKQHFTGKNLKKLITKKNIKIAAIGILLVLIGIPIFTYIYFASDLKDKNSIMNRNNAGVKLLDDQGELFFSFYNPKNIEPVPLAQISEHAKKAVVAAEDKNFYENPGFSIRGITRAVVENIKSVSIEQGGSTITQQLVKNALLTSDRNFLRKYQEFILALEIERRFSKDDILEMYLNSVYFGEGAFGIENASQEYFGKTAKDLTLSESSLLVAILPAPSAFNPRSGDFDSAKERQEIVLTKMQEANQITEAQKNQALNQKLVVVPPKPDGTNTLAPHFAVMVRDFLIDEYGEEKITRNGFVVKTTLNRRWQESAQSYLKGHISRLSRNKASNGAAIVIDPKTGNIKVMVGSHDWENEENGKINMALAPRQPGSSFKPIIYSKALEDRKVTPATIIKDEAVTFGSYKPRNYDNRFRGDVTVRYALANSLNIPAIKVLEMIGVKKGIETASDFGITTLDKNKDYGLPLVLGAGEVSLAQMTSAYSAFANGGERTETNFILEIKDKNGKTQNFKEAKKSRAISDGAAFLIASILADAQIRTDVFGGSLNTSSGAAVKTGTTEDYKDALTVGFTPNAAVGVWVGNNDNTPMDRVAGSSGAAPIFVSIMNTVSSQKANFQIPSSVLERQLCTDKPVSQSSPLPNASPGIFILKEYFIRGTAPTECVIPSPSPATSPSVEPTPTPSDPTPTPSPQLSPTPIPSVIPSPLVSPSLLPSPI